MRTPQLRARSSVALRARIFPRIALARRGMQRTLRSRPFTPRMQIHRVDLVQHSTGALAVARDEGAEVTKTKITRVETRGLRASRRSDKSVSIANKVVIVIAEKTVREECEI